MADTGNQVKKHSLPLNQRAIQVDRSDTGRNSSLPTFFWWEMHVFMSSPQARRYDTGVWGAMRGAIMRVFINKWTIATQAHSHSRPVSAERLRIKVKYGRRAHGLAPLSYWGPRGQARGRGHRQGDPALYAAKGPR